jgi:membrane protease YdiL (CAAX protease family)
MKGTDRILSGLVITTAIFLIANAVGINVHLNSKLIADSFITHTVMLFLSALVIYVMRRKMSYKISLPKFKTVLKPVLIGIVSTIVINLLMTILTKIAGGKIEVHPLFAKMNPVQVFIYVFLYASLAEEILFRGFLLNFLNSSTKKGIVLFKRNFSFRN